MNFFWIPSSVSSFHLVPISFIIKTSKLQDTLKGCKTMAFFLVYSNLFLDVKKSPIQSKVSFSTFEQIIINSYNCMMIWKNWINEQIPIRPHHGQDANHEKKQKENTNMTRPRNIIIIKTLKMLWKHKQCRTHNELLLLQEHQECCYKNINKIWQRYIIVAKTLETLL